MTCRLLLGISNGCSLGPCPRVETAVQLWTTPGGLNEQELEEPEKFLEETGQEPARMKRYVPVG